MYKKKIVSGLIFDPIWELAVLFPSFNSNFCCYIYIYIYAYILIYYLINTCKYDDKEDIPIRNVRLKKLEILLNPA
jgi:hypothetical protein